MIVVFPRLLGVTALLGVVLAFAAFRFDPMRKHARILCRGVAGLGLLLVWNGLQLPHLGVNPLSVMLTGALGLPGVALMAVLAQLP